MGNKIIPFIKIVKAMIFAGQPDDNIHSWLFENSLQINNSEIEIVRQECRSTPDGLKMVDENRIRLENNEDPIILDSIVDQFSKTDYFKILVIDFSGKTPLMQRGKLLNFPPEMILNDAKLRKLVENFSMTYADFCILNQLAAELELKSVDERDYEVYLEYFYDTRKNDQHQMAEYLYDNRGHSQYVSYINPVRDGIENIRHSFGLIEPDEILREISYHNYQLQKKLKNNLIYEREIDPWDVTNLRSSQKNILKLGAYNIVSEAEGDQYKKCNHFMEGDDIPIMHQHYIFITPHKNSIKILLIMGFQIEKVKDILRLDKFNDIPNCFMENIYKECISLPDGEKMINDNQKNQLEHKALASFSSVRDIFKDKELYDKAIKLSGKIEKLSDLMLEDILDNDEKRRFLDCCIMADTPFKRVREAWTQLFSESLKEKEYNTYKCYILNLGFDYEMGLYQYLEQDPENQLYRDYKYLLGKDTLDVIDYFGVADEQEYIDINIRMWGQLNHTLEDAIEHGDTDLATLLQKELTQIGEIFRKGNEDDDKIYFRTQMEKIFARIKGSDRTTMTLDQVHLEKNNIVLNAQKEKEKEKK
ncbi:MAG: hypothetical protein HOD64_12105 [Candidatus Cloacimonetes bacterium]|jgi:hypothetical protein|nr:hypothetical protein [Candidatus Cloacimonadota bacterium]MBT4334005.1 hypothetical protein [Candidatus Cloacimonadota bacterium]